MKKLNYIKKILYKLGFTSHNLLKNITLHYIDSDGYLYFTDAGGNKFKANLDSEKPILLDSDTIVITIESLNDMKVGETQQIQIKNEDNISVINECFFTVPSDFKHLISINSTGLITALKQGSNIYIEIIHEDFDILLNPGASGTTTTFNIL